ncbi:MAG: leucine-rich repeat domain-containing protein [Clostridia bacterium]|nr:leucine-rich repeat domain-containing protein [Clostridia bacterium]
MQENEYIENKLLSVDDDYWFIDEGELWTCKIEDAKRVAVPDGVIKIEEYAFPDQFFLQEIFLPKSVRQIDKGAFSGCDKLNSIIIENEEIYLEQGCLKDIDNLKRVYIGGQRISVIVTQGKLAGHASAKVNCLERYLGKDEEYCVDGDVAIIGETAFVNSVSLKKVVIPQSVLEIHERAFDGCKSLQELELPNDLEIIGRFAFDGCVNIKEIKIPQSVCSLEYMAFFGWNSNQRIYVPSKWKKAKLMQSWRRGCKAKIIYY